MRIYLAAIETSRENATACLRAGVPHVLTSFFYAGYMRRTPRDVWLQCLRAAKVRMIDSGAFTLRTSAFKLVSTSGSENAQGVNYNQFLDAYITWLRRYKAMGLCDVWVELDIAKMTGDAWVHWQRDKIISAGLGDGLMCVWHSEQDWAYWLYLLREAKRPGRSGYVAIEGHQLDREPLDYNRFLKAAYDRGVRVHGFRMTSQEAIHRWPFFSVDSTSWISPVTSGSYTMRSQLGGVVNMRSHNLGSVDQSIRPSWRGVMPSKRTTSKVRVDALIASAQAWVDAERHMTGIWLARGVDWEAAIRNPEVIE